MEYKIFSYVDDLENSYLNSINIVDGLPFDQKDTLRTIDFYTNSKYISGNRDSLGREKPFYNVVNYRVTTAKVATDIDVKDIRFEPDSLKDSMVTMVYNHELFKYLKEINFSKTLNDMGIARPKYGGLLIKKYYEEDGKMCIDVVDWKNVSTDPSDICENPIIENHYLTPAELAEKSEMWYDVETVIEEAYKDVDNAHNRILVKEVTGSFPTYYDPDIDDDKKSKYRYQKMCFYIAYVGGKKYLLYKENLKKEEERYMYLPWERIPGRALGRGVVEDGFESQVWINDAMIAMKNAMELSGKVLLTTTSKRLSGNAITQLENGTVIELEDGKTVSSLNLLPSAFPQFNNLISLWNEQYNRAASTYDANTGEAPPSGTPYSQTALLNQVANSPFEYQREVWGIFLNQVLNKWILPELKKRILKKHYLVSEFSREELDVIDQAIKARDTNKMLKEKLLQAVMPTQEDVANTQTQIDTNLKKLGAKREIEIPAGFLDIEGKITANITGELKNKAAMLASLDNILKTIIATFNPNTGQYSALQDPVLSQIFGSIVELAGAPISFGTLRGLGQGEQQPAAAQTTPTSGADLSAITPITDGTASAL